LSQIENVYPLSPMQQGMLFHTLYAPESGVYFEQMTCELAGELDLTAFERAWRRVAERHAVLRTAFDWQSLDEPVQVVLAGVDLPLAIEDWRGVDPAERDARLDALLAEDRERGFDLASAPLVRLRLLHLGERLNRFVWSHHHLLLDGWSMPILFREFFVFYRAARRGEEVELPVPRPYADYVAWLVEQDRKGAEDFWRHELAGFTAPTPLGFSRRLEPLPRKLYDQRKTAISEAATAALEGLARRAGLTPSTMLQTAWALLLGRWSGEHDVLFGVVVAGRPAELAGVESMVGLFLNTLPVRLRLVPGRPFDETAAELQGRLLELRAHEASSLADVQGWSEVPRGRPLFESIVVFENYPVDDAGAAGADGLGLELSGYRAIEQTSLPLTLHGQPGGARLGLAIKYDARRFTAEAVDEILAQLAAVLETAAGDPERRLGDFSLVTPRARTILPDPAAVLPVPSYDLLPSRFLEMAAARPERPAVEEEGRVVTYRELRARALAVAADLRAEGLAPGEAVALSGPRSADLVAGALGIVLAGGVLVPIDPALPAERRRRLRELAGARRRLDSASAAGAAAADLPAVCGDDPAYVFFTSGSTGKPKPVLGRHRGLAHFLAWQRARFGVGPGERFAQLTGLSFDVLMRDVFLPLTSGATLCLPPPGTTAASPGLPEWLAARRVTGLHAVPSVARAWLTGAPREVDLSALRYLFFAGEPLADDLVERLRRTFAVAGEIVNLYGPTETTLAKCFFPVPDPPEPGIQPLGRPLPETQALILSGDRLHGLGEPGEIVIRTPFRSLGFLGGDSSGDRFAANPFRDDPDDLLYRTGDLGVLREDGLLEFRGRLDEQVKIRGARVEPKEVEAALRTHPDVGDVAVVARDDGPGGEKWLVAYVVPAIGEPEPSARELGLHARESLPATAVPSAFVVLGALPLTPNGKLDRAALPAPSTSRPELAEPYQPARDPLELRLVHVWEEILGIAPVGVRDDFFDLGGHSLLVAPLVGRIERDLGHSISLASLFEAPTVETQALQLRRSEPGIRRRDVVVALQPRGEATPFFCAHPLGGSPLCYQDLARRLGPERPFYGFDALHLVGTDVRYRSLEEMAAVYAGALREVHPGGGYCLGGWSFGGMVAFAVAQALRRQGAEVALLAVIDTFLVGAGEAADLEIDQAVILKELLGSSIERTTEELRAMEEEEQLRYVVELGRSSGALPRDFDLDDARAILSVVRMNGDLVKRYRPPRYPGRLTLVLSQERADDEREPLVERWGELAASLDVRVVPGTHRNLVAEPWVDGLAESLREALDRAVATAEVEG